MFECKGCGEVKAADDYRVHKKGYRIGKPWTGYQGIRDGGGHLIRIENHPDSGRAVYRRLKREAR